MSITALVIIIVAAIILLFAGIKIIKGGLAQIIIGLIVLAGLGWASYRYFIK
jgi:hypothetical protein